MSCHLSGLIPSAVEGKPSARTFILPLELEGFKETVFHSYRLMPDIMGAPPLLLVEVVGGNVSVHFLLYVLP